MVDGGAPPPPPRSPGGSGPDTRQLYNLWFVGVLAYVVGATCQALGANLQRLSAQQEGPEKGTERTPRALLHGHVGLALFALGGIVCSLALLFASEALVAPLVVLLFIINPIFAYQLNGEPFRLATDGVCTAFIMVGIVIVVGFEPHESDSYSIAHMAWLFQQSTFIGFVTVVVGLLGITWWWRRYVQRRETIADLSRHLVQLSHGGLAGGFGGLNITLTKAIFTLITGQYDEGSRVLGGGYGGGLRAIFSYWLLYVLAIAIIVTYVLELRLTADGLRQSKTMIFVPTFVVVEQIVVCLGAMLFFQDFAHFYSVETALLFAFGNFLALACVVIMAWMRLQGESGEASTLLPHDRGPQGGGAPKQSCCWGGCSSGIP